MNSFKTFMNKVSDRVRDATLEGGVVEGGQLTPSSSIGGDMDGADQDTGTVEGFVCPSCYTTFQDADKLQAHYEREHLDPASNYVCPVCKLRLTSQQQLETHYSQDHARPEGEEVTVDALKEELREVSTTLREERWHTDDLRNELQALQQALQAKAAAGGEDGEKEDMVPQSQHAALLDSKTNLSNEAVLLRRQQSQALEDLAAVRRQLADTISKAERLAADKSSMESRASECAVERADLRAKLDLITEERTMQDMQLQSSQLQQSAGSSAEIDRLAEELSRLQTMLQDRDKQVEGYQQREAHLNQDLKSKSECVAEQKQEMKGLKEEVDALKKKLQKSSSECGKTGEELTARSAELVALTAANAELRQKQTQNTDTITALQEQVDDSVSSNSHLTEEVSRLQQELQSKQEQITAADLDRSTLEQHCSQKSMEVSRLQDQLGDLSREEDEVVARKTQQVQQLQQQLLQEEQNRRDIDTKLAGAEGALSQTSSRLTTAEKTTEQLQEKLAGVQEKAAYQATQIRQLTEERDRLQLLEKELDSSRSQVTSLTASIEQMNNELNQCKRKETEREKSLQSAQGSLTAMEADKSILLSKTVALKDDVDSKDKIIAELQKKAAEQIELNKDLVIRLQDAVSGKEEAQSSNQQLRSKLESIELSLKDVTEELEVSNAELEAKTREFSRVSDQLKATKQTQQETEESLNRRLELAEKNCSDLTEQKEQSNAELTALKSKHSELNERLCATEEEKKKVEDDRKETREQLKSAESESGALRQQLQAAEAHTADAKDRTNVLQQEVEQLYTQISDASNAAADRVVQHATELDDVQQHLDAVNSAAKHKTTDLQQQLEQVVKKLTSSDARATEEQSRVEETELQLATLQAQLAELQGDKLELEVRLECVEKEQRSLVERCVGAEGEVEILNQTITQMRRKLDDSTAALHELGLQNQSLQLETNKLSGRKWAEDEDVKQCHSCHKAFSMTIRRHHCRNCCQIFCGECSAKQAPLDANKKPVRVCDTCHNEIANRLTSH
uniref:Early endosome antigen 1-like n=1 Tax=Hirondellea gigas TaxID=1518452 RepID=A0A6A7G0K5_9CRUS